MLRDIFLNYVELTIGILSRYHFLLILQAFARCKPVDFLNTLVVQKVVYTTDDFLQCPDG